jgi:hypothetical protein
MLDASEYIIVISNEDDYHASYHHFADKVTRKLKAGYRLYGAPFAVKQAVCQAMIRPGESSSGNDTATTFSSAGGYHA